MTTTGSKETAALRFWKASLAWKNVGDWAKGWTTEGFIEELRHLCVDNGAVGFRADALLDDMIHDVERRPREIPGIIVPFTAKTQIAGQQAVAN